jgi:predicted transcriptional regulator
MSNLIKIYSHLLQNNIWYSRPELVEELKLPRTTIYDNLEKLLINNLIKKSKRKNPIGRPTTIWNIIN